MKPASAFAVVAASIAIAFAARPARAATHRLAIVVGNNAGQEAPVLHYAETDASKVARVLVELGGVDAGDLHLLQGGSLAALRATFVLAQQRVAELHRDPASRVIVIFYFSGHSDGEALELGRERFGFSDLRRTLAGLGADVRVALVDSCRSGALLTAKGGSAAPEFQIRLTDELASSGEALLTSSAADEVALESREIAGSFFTHHLVSGLRGAADTSGDGIVTLAEAYQYAYSHTIATTGATTIGPQHPAYDYHLAGQGELGLTDVSKPSAVLELPSGFDRVLVVDAARGQVIAELTNAPRRKLALEPGSYTIRAWRGGHVLTGLVTIRSGEQRVVAEAELAAVADSAPLIAKGALAVDASVIAPAVAHAQRSFAIGIGTGTSIAAQLYPSVSLHASFIPAHRGVFVSADVRTATGFNDGPFRETGYALHVGYALHGRAGRLSGWLAVAAGPTLITQTNFLNEGGALGLAVAPNIGASAELAGGVALALQAEVAPTLIAHDGVTAISALAGLWLGVEVHR